MGITSKDPPASLPFVDKIFNKLAHYSSLLQVRHINFSTLFSVKLIREFDRLILSSSLVTGLHRYLLLSPHITEIQRQLFYICIFLSSPPTTTFIYFNIIFISNIQLLANEVKNQWLYLLWHTENRTRKKSYQFFGRTSKKYSL